MQVKVELNRQGVGELLNSQWAQSVCEEAATEIAASQPELEVMPARHTGQRVVVTVAQRGGGNQLLKAAGGRHG